MSIHIGPYTFDQVRYDAEADVLYLSIGDPGHAVDFDETADGHVLRFDQRGELVGVTIIDAQRRVKEGGGELVLDLPARVNAEDLAHSFTFAG
jgi:uncharacterized protein YuzE